MSNKYNEFSVINHLPEDIQRYIFKYVPLYDRLYLPSEFIENLFQQLFECRNKSFQKEKYISYYNNLRTTLFPIFKIPWDSTGNYKQSNIMYSMNTINQDVHVSIMKSDRTMFSYDEMLYIENVFYDTRVDAIDCSIHEYITEKIQIQVYYFMGAREFELTIHTDISDDIIENRFITLDRILNQLHINIFDKIK